MTSNELAYGLARKISTRKKHFISFNPMQYVVIRRPTQEVPEDYTEISLVCVRQDGMYLGREARKNSARLPDKVVEND